MSHTSTTADRASPTPTALRVAPATPESGFVPHRTGVVQVPGDAAELRARIKVLLPEIALTENFLRRFEAQLLALVQGVAA